MVYRSQISMYFLLIISSTFLFFCSTNTEKKTLADSLKAEVGIKDTIIVPEPELKPKYEQIIIPLNNKLGVPFSYNERLDEYYLPGFEIGQNEMFYFLGGKKSIITCFNVKKEIFRNEYEEFLTNQLHIFNNQLYVFDYKYGKNNLFILDKSNGLIQDSLIQITENKVNNYYFIDSTLVTRVFNYQERIDMNTELAYIRFNLKGELIGSVDNIYNLPDGQKQKKNEEFIGYWGNTLVYWGLDSDNWIYKFIIRDKEGNTIEIKDIEGDFFGNPFYGLSGNPQEHRKLRNGKIYVLGRKGSDAVITILPLKKLFATELPMDAKN